MTKLIPELAKSFDFILGMPEDQWNTINYWFVRPERFPVTVKNNTSS